MEPIVRFEAVSKRYGSLAVLDNLCLEVMPGERVTIIGPSGSGKTTVLRALMTLDKISEGVIWVAGRPITHMPRKAGGLAVADERYQRTVRGDVGMVFQQFNLFPHMTALQNCMEAPMRVNGMSRTEAESRAADLLKMVGLLDKTRHYPSQLSGGQQQRVAIARALAMRPKVMLFDEVTSALDPEVIGEVLAVIRNLAAEHKLTILMVTHQMAFAREFSDRVCFFHGGRVHEQGGPDELFGAPREERTRAFLHVTEAH